MKHLRRYNESVDNVDNVLDTINDILLEMNHDIDGWSAKTWKKYDGRTLPQDDIVVVLKRTGQEDYGDMDYQGEGEVIEAMKIPQEVINTIIRLVDFMYEYKFDMIVGNDDIGPGLQSEDEYESETYIKDGKLIDKDGYHVSELWMNEFIKIEFTK
jgi:hypothetical protein